ncbi:CPBP family intramembrane glutamic endopeptidase [Chengkuizengella sediminis]|uniref:CPBP family intramembrane glutamic endopeptidase n=1 Tax=Chengkuizengella sediminis TaxID=1885917 RepID=UPI0013894936|nr:CPBP family intramembrane glutamic endopeptidase [Chengkuizengella sediminis]NDI36807.1 CPBP family intramembrane metalloprotease [Chengkuizengella sediminis]
MEQSHSTRNVILIALISFFIFLVMSFLPSENNEEVLLNDEKTISIQQAEESALQFLFDHYNVDVNQVETLLTFQTQKQLGGYLQKNDLVSDYNEQYGDSNPIDYFQIQVNDATQKYLVNIHMTSGNVLGWKTIDGNMNTEELQQQEIAELFLIEQGYNINNFYLLPQDENEMSNYIFESYEEGVADAKLQLHTIIEADQVISFNMTFSIPEPFVTWMEKQDNQASLMSVLMIIFNVIFGIIALIISIVLRKHISFSKGILLTLIFLAIYTITNFNMYPVNRAMFSEEGNDTAIIMMVVSIIIYALLSVILYFTSISADGIWKDRSETLWPNRKNPNYGNHVIKAMGFGYLFSFIILAVQSIFYFIGETFFDVWSVSDLTFSPYNLWMPGLMPLIAWAAAISEEIIYRWFGIPLFKKIFRSTIVAVIISSMVWAIGHMAYPIYPAYTRFFEVTIIGLIFGYIFLKFGFMTAVFAHAIVDSILFSLQLVYFDFSKYALLSLFYMVLPAIVAYIMFKFHQRFKRNYPDPPEEMS